MAWVIGLAKCRGAWCGLILNNHEMLVALAEDRIVLCLRHGLRVANLVVVHVHTRCTAEPHRALHDDDRQFAIDHALHLHLIGVGAVSDASRGDMALGAKVALGGGLKTAAVHCV